MHAKFTKGERLEIGRQIYVGELNSSQAAVKYDISQYTARDYLRLYKASIQMKPEIFEKDDKPYEDMTKEELIEELRKLKK